MNRTSFKESLESDADIRWRIPTSADINMIVKWYLCPNVGSNIQEHDQTEDELKEWIRLISNSNPIKDNQCAFIIHQGSNSLAFVHAMWINWQSKTVEIDLCFNPIRAPAPFLVLSIFREIGNIVFDLLDLRKIYSFVYVRNIKAIRIFEKIMVREAILDNYLGLDDNKGDIHIFGLLKNQFDLKRSKSKKKYDNHPSKWTSK